MPPILTPIVNGWAWLATHWHLLLIVSTLLACGYRERGQHHSWLGTQGARMLFWATPVTLAVFILRPDLPWLAYPTVWMAALLGMILVPHGVGQDLTVPWVTPDSETDGMKRIARPERMGYLWLAGVVRLLLIATALYPWVTPVPGFSTLGGLALPLGYLAGVYLPKLPWRLTTHTEWGEFLSGLLLGIPIVIVLAP